MQTLMSPYPLPLIFAVPQPFLCSLSGTQMLTPWVSDQKCDPGFLQPWTLRKLRQVQEGVLLKAKVQHFSGQSCCLTNFACDPVTHVNVHVSVLIAEKENKAYLKWSGGPGSLSVNTDHI